jgi:NAD(P)-dependent dehydrogenase (short-subunit alcohol dehydrogenase family)
MDSTKVALVTASSAGLGAAIAEALIGEMRVVINYHSNAERANVVMKALADYCHAQSIPSEPAQPRFIAVQADMSKRSEIQHLVDETIAKMGRLDVVVSNAGWTRITNFADLGDNVDEDDWDRCFNVNVKSHLFLLHAAQPHLEKTEGSFTTIASVAGIKPSGSSIVSSLFPSFFSWSWILA